MLTKIALDVNSRNTHRQKIAIRLNDSAHAECMYVCMYICMYVCM